MLKLIFSKISFTILLCILFVGSTFSQTNWTRYDHNPVLEPGGMDKWDKNFAIATTVLFEDSIYKMWYEGDEGFGYATSPDGVMWTKDTINNPVLTQGPSFWDASSVENASVLFIDSTYRMWYSGVDLSENNRIGHATSPDGINWTKYPPNPVLEFGSPGTWDDEELIHPFVIYEDSVYKMWYNGHDGNKQRILYATSSDGIEWSRFTDHPALEPGKFNSWDETQLGPLCVLHNQNGYHMWYTGFNRFDSIQIGYAFSEDGISWTKDEINNPVLSPDSSSEWEKSGVALPLVLQDDNVLKMWYGGTDGTIFQTGYATSEIINSVGDNQIVPDKINYNLEQNYPNPFNPRTVISWQLAVGSKVELNVYNLRGQKVSTLLSEYQTAGKYNVEWDASGLSSGVYYYRLTTGEFQDVKKMILLK